MKGKLVVKSVTRRIDPENDWCKGLPETDVRKEVDA